MSLVKSGKSSSLRVARSRSRSSDPTGPFMMPMPFRACSNAFPTSDAQQKDPAREDVGPIRRSAGTLAVATVFVTSVHIGYFEDFKSSNTLLLEGDADGLRA